MLAPCAGADVEIDFEPFVTEAEVDALQVENEPPGSARPSGKSNRTTTLLRQAAKSTRR